MTPGYLIPSPLGDIALRVEDDFLTGLFFVGQKYFPQMALTRIGTGAPPLALYAQRQITQFFSGDRRDFELPIALRGTPFQRRVWKALEAIPFGRVTTYAEVARRLHLDSGHARAVGSAVGRNPISVIIPCHRVVATNGALTGYAGGVDRKAALLELEQVDRFAALDLPLAAPV